MCFPYQFFRSMDMLCQAKKIYNNLLLECFEAFWSLRFREIHWDRCLGWGSFELRLLAAKLCQDQSNVPQGQRSQKRAHHTSSSWRTGFTIQSDWGQVWSSLFWHIMTKSIASKYSKLTRSDKKWPVPTHFDFDLQGGQAPKKTTDECCLLKPFATGESSTAYWPLKEGSCLYFGVHEKLETSSLLVQLIESLLRITVGIFLDVPKRRMLRHPRQNPKNPLCEGTVHVVQCGISNNSNSR